MLFHPPAQFSQELGGPLSLPQSQVCVSYSITCNDVLVDTLSTASIYPTRCSGYDAFQSYRFAVFQANGRSFSASGKTRLRTPGLTLIREQEAPYLSLSCVPEVFQYNSVSMSVAKA